MTALISPLGVYYRLFSSLWIAGRGWGLWNQSALLFAVPGDDFLHFGDLLLTFFLGQADTVAVGVGLEGFLRRGLHPFQIAFRDLAVFLFGGRLLFLLDGGLRLLGLRLAALIEPLFPGLELVDGLLRIHLGRRFHRFGLRPRRRQLRIMHLAVFIHPFVHFRGRLAGRNQRRQEDRAQEAMLGHCPHLQDIRNSTL